MRYKRGEVLIPREDFVMSDGEVSYTKGVSYTIEAVKSDRYMIIDDHVMSETDIREWLLL